MTKKMRLGVIVLLTCTMAVASAAASRPAAVSRPTKVTSSIDRLRVLPLRLRWIARTNLPAAKLREVDFVIDGKVRWIEHRPPYTYGGDDNGRDLGFLITTWLKPGMHHFTVRAVPVQGRVATHTVAARVLPAPRPPAELAGRWSRTLTKADVAKSGPEPPPAGRWEVIFDRVGAWHLDPLGSGVVNQYEVAADVVHVYAPIQMAPFSEKGGGVARYGHHGIGGTDCTFAGPFGSYRFAVSGDKLTLTVIHEGCPNRRAIWEGVWSRAK